MLKVKELKKFHATGNKKKVTIAILIADKVDLKPKMVTYSMKVII